MVEPFSQDGIAVITGGASGIGRAAVRRAARTGMKVALVDTNTAKIDAITSELAAVIGAANVVARTADVADFSTCRNWRRRFPSAGAARHC